MFGQSLLSAFGSAACTTDTDQLFTTDVQTTSTATYQLNNATTSIPSNTYPGTANNITYAAGKFGNAAVFNGSSSYVALPTGQFNYSNFTISSWVYPTSAPTVRGSILTTYMYTSGPSKGYVFGINNNMTVHFSCYYDDSGNRITADTTQTVPFNQWTQLSLSFSTVDSKVIFYINGVAVKTTTFSGNVLRYETNNNTSIGVLKYSNSNVEQYFVGKIDQLRIFNSALPQAAVTALYNETTTTATYPYVDYVNANPNSIAYYKMSDATDQFGNYNGTASNVNFNTVGKFGFAGAFNGLQNSSASYINISSSTTSTTSSVSLWFNTTVKDSNYGNILDAGGGSSGNTGFAIIRRPTTGFLQVNFTDGTTGQIQSFTGATDITDGAWHNVVLSMAADNTFVFYLDGSSHLSGTRTRFTSGQSQNLSINRFGTNAGSIGASSYSGSIDQIRIYDSALSAANVTTLYNEIECPAVAVTNAFNTVIYTGNSGTQQISTVGFQPDMVWTKQRSSPSRDHLLNDSVRGANKILYPNLTNVEGTAGGSGSAYFNSFDSNGYTVGSSNYYNGSSLDYVSWNWKAGGTAVSNTDGTITSQVSANVDAGFSIVSYTSQSSGTATVGHGLSSPPDMVIVKTTGVADSWRTYHSSLGEGFQIFLNLTNAASGTANQWNNTSPTNSVFSLGTDNAGSYTTIAYCFRSISGYSRVGSYIGNGSTTGPIIYTGFRPRFIMTKPYSIGDNWSIWGVNQSGDDIDQILVPNNDGAQSAIGFGRYDITLSSTGFQLKRTDSQINQNGAAYIFMAIA